MVPPREARHGSLGVRRAADGRWLLRLAQALSLAAICLWTVTVYLAVRRQRWIIAFLPAAFMTFIVSFYIFIAEEGLHLPYYTGLAVGTALTAAIVGVMAWYLCSVRRGRIAI